MGNELLASMTRWADERWTIVHGWTTYDWRSRPGATVSLWIGSGLNRAIGLLSRDGRGPLLGAVDFGVLQAEPVVGSESSGYGYRIHPITKRRKFHKGVDFKAKRGTQVHAAGPGVVTVARRRGTYGKLVIISHGMGLETRYAHLHRIKVEEGQFVPAGALIALVGSTGRSTGPHLHFEVRQFGEPVDPHWAMGQTRKSITDELTGMVTWLAPKSPVN